MISKEELRQAWRCRFSHLSETQDRLRRVAFRWVRVGRVATDSRLADGTGMPLQSMHDDLTTLEQQGLIVRNARGVVGIYGLSLVETPYHLHLDGHALFTWCALDAVGIPAGLRVDAEIAAQCYHCQQDVAIHFQSGRMVSASPAALRIWLPLPQTGRSVAGET